MTCIEPCIITWHGVQLSLSWGWRFALQVSRFAAVTKATEGELAGTAIEEKEAAFFSFGVSRSKYKVPMDNSGKCQVKNPQIQQYFRASNFETSKSDIP